MFTPVTPNVNFPQLEEEILNYWKKEKIFEKSIDQRPEDKKWTFLDGPPFITGLPHYGSLLSSIPKDVFPRYWTMKGYRVRRVWGWDCHGLPAENKVEEKLGLKRKKDIEEKVGVKTFIDECKAYVGQVSTEWEWYVDHIGRWVDFKNAYRTMDTSYMESVMWVFSQMYKKGHIYKGLRVSLYCPHCATPISNFEVAMDPDNYKEITEPSTTYKYQLQDERDTYLLAWSTTPWNKLATPALAVNPDLTYIKVAQGKEKYILAKNTVKMLTGEWKQLEEFPGSALVGKKFVPHFDFYPIEKGKNVFVVIPGSFVTEDDGTGIVTIAAYGEDDLAAMKQHNIQIVLHVDEEGMVKAMVPKWGGMYYLKVNPLVDEDLKQRGLIYQHTPHTHTVPTCWRCHTRLYYAPQDAWYVNVQDLKEKMKKTNESVHWFPDHFKNGRFLKSLENAPDWNISRSRYWGSPVPVWECECGERFVPGSIKELEEASGRKITELHKPDIDDVTVPCKKCGKKAHRVAEVLDSWIEAGSASFGERHYPFEGKKDVTDFYPPDFIGEYTGQIRAWFYVLHVIANALDLRKDGQNILSKNVLVEGVILGTDGRKMSKNYGNYPDPKEMLKKYGGDALRLYLMGSPVMHGEDALISEEEYRNQVRGFLLMYWNVYNFFVTYANALEWKPEMVKPFKPKHVMDRWVLSELNLMIGKATQLMEAFDTVGSIAQLRSFNDNLSKWYVRRIRDRVSPSSDTKEDTGQALQTLWIVLTEFSKTLAPIAPFTAEEIFRNLTGKESVHLEMWPKEQKKYIDDTLAVDMHNAVLLSSDIHAKRKEAQVKVRIPFKEFSYSGPKRLDSEIEEVIAQETNVISLRYGGKAAEYTAKGSTDAANQDLVAGKAREIVRQVQMKRKEDGLGMAQRIRLFLPDWPTDFADYIKRETLADSLQKADELKVEPV